MPRFTAALLAILVGLAALPQRAEAMPGGSLKTYRTFVTQTLKLKASGTKRVEGGTAEDWYHTFAGKSQRGLPLELRVQVGGDRIYAQALTVTASTGRQGDVDEVVALAERFWAEATNGYGKAMSKEIAPKIAAGLPTGVARHKDVAASLTKVGAGDKIIFVVGAEYQPARKR
jgi:hypothetical protein